MSGTTKEYYRHAFKRVLGVTPFKYVSRLKLSEAKVMLSETSTNIKEIAAELGFADANYFSRFFRKCTGISPIVYRERFNARL